MENLLCDVAPPGLFPDSVTARMIQTVVVGVLPQFGSNMGNGLAVIKSILFSLDKDGENGETQLKELVGCKSVELKLHKIHNGEANPMVE
jgi:hypothetical protein